jgi:hypothetical protein
MLHTRFRGIRRGSAAAARSSLIAGCAALLLAAVAAATDKPPFPRTGAIAIGKPQNYDDRAYQTKLAKVDLSLLSYWPGWNDSHDMSMEQVVRNIKADNPDAKVFLYQNSMQVDANSQAFEPLYRKVEQMRWWAYPAGTGGNRILASYAAKMADPQPIYVTNTTLFTPRDSSGYQWWEYHARWAVQNYYKPSPSIAGLYEDNVFWRPRIDADWNRDGVTDPQKGASAGKWLREGYRKRFALMHQLMPGKYMIGNIADWGHKDAVLTELNGTLDGGVMEGIMGASYSPERWASWAEMMRWYRKTMAAIAEPKLVMFHQSDDPTDFQAMRYGLASCLLDNAYYVFTKRGAAYTGVYWFDELDADLGQASSPPATTAWQKGVYRRDFENGIALVNPRGNGPVEVVLEEDFKRITGKQAPSVNNGQVTRKVQLSDRDGIILMRIKSKPLPTAPKLIGVH